MNRKKESLAYHRRCRRRSRAPPRGSWAGTLASPRPRRGAWTHTPRAQRHVRISLDAGHLAHSPIAPPIGYSYA
eukprot:1858212-Rhodomonas_salina.1